LQKGRERKKVWSNNANKVALSQSMGMPLPGQGDIKYNKNIKNIECKHPPPLFILEDFQEKIYLVAITSKYQY